MKNLTFSESTISLLWIKIIARNSGLSCVKTWPTIIYLIKVSNRNIRKRREICSKWTKKAPERRQWRLLGLLNLFFENISNLFLVFLWLKLSMHLFACNSLQSRRSTDLHDVLERSFYVWKDFRKNHLGWLVLWYILPILWNEVSFQGM